MGELRDTAHHQRGKVLPQDGDTGTEGDGREVNERLSFHWSIINTTMAYQMCVKLKFLKHACLYDLDRVDYKLYCDS